jgi:hypothetical protein
MQSICCTENNQQSVNHSALDWLWLSGFPSNSTNVFRVVKAVVPQSLGFMERQNVEVIAHVMRILLGL